ncbi:unnamed protein product, partial [Ixodes pacificus]
PPVPRGVAYRNTFHNKRAHQGHRTHERPPPPPPADSHFLSMWNVHCALIKRWRRRNQNTTLHDRINALNQDCPGCDDTLAIQHWLDLHTNLNGQLHIPRLWN